MRNSTDAHFISTVLVLVKTLISFSSLKKNIFKNKQKKGLHLKTKPFQFPCVKKSFQFPVRL